MKKLLLGILFMLAPALAAAQNPVTITPMEGTPADAESNTEPFLSRVGMRGYFFNGSTWDRFRGDTTSGLWVNVKAVPTDPFGANADAASATGSISAKLRFIASTGIPITGSVAVTGTFWQATQPVSNAGTFAVQATQTTSPWIVAGGGTAGTAATGVVTVQGIASMTKLLVTPDANSAVNVAQINGVTPLMGAGNTGTGSARVTIATDQAALPGLAIAVEDAAETAGGNLAMVGTVRRDTAASSAGTTGDNATLNTDDTGKLWARIADPCSAYDKTYAPFSITTAATTVLIAASASNKNYVCSFEIVVAGADNVAMVEDASGSCASPDAGMAGGTTAASGWNFAANSGLARGNGNGTVYKTASTNVNTCLITSAAVQASGVISYVQKP